MIKTVTQFKVIINEIESVFNFDSNCPTNIAKDALFACLKWVGQIEDSAKAQEEANKLEEKPVECDSNEIAEVINE